MSDDPQAPFTTYLHPRRAWIEEALRAHLPQGHPRPLFAAMERTLLAPGQRLHPVLVLAAAEAVGGDGQELLGAAAAVEMAYRAARCPVPSEEDAPSPLEQLTRDALLALAFELLATPRGDLAASRRLAAVHDLARCAGCAGSVGGVAAGCLTAGDEEVSLPELELILTHRDGAWLTAAVRIGARLAGATPEAMESLTRYGHHAGLALAIHLDLQHTDPHPGGRPAPSYSGTLGPSAARQRLAELTGRAEEDLIPLGDAATPLRWLLHTLAEGAH